jgi:7-cyano-7-deazaguanine reductase
MKQITENDFPFVKNMESMSKEDLAIRVKKAYNWQMDKLVLMPYFGRDELVKYSYPELVAKCPATGLLDTYKLNIEFVPNKLLPELKSLRFYLLGYENLPIGHEAIASKIYTDFKKYVKPKKLILDLEVAVRGGIYTSVKVEK